MNQHEAETVTRRVLGIHLPGGWEPVWCPAGDGWWHACRDRAGTDPRHDKLARQAARRMARARAAGAPPEEGLIIGPVLGVTPMSEGEGAQLDRLARGESVPEHPSACASQPACGHAQVWHRHAGRARPCEVPGCTCLDYVSQAVPVRS